MGIHQADPFMPRLRRRIFTQLQIHLIRCKTNTVIQYIYIDGGLVRVDIYRQMSFPILWLQSMYHRIFDQRLQSELRYAAIQQRGYRAVYLIIYFPVETGVLKSHVKLGILKLLGESYFFRAFFGNTGLHELTPVSYTHLDVYKRQEYGEQVRIGTTHFISEIGLFAHALNHAARSVEYLVHGRGEIVWFENIERITHSEINLSACKKGLLDMIVSKKDLRDQILSAFCRPIKDMDYVYIPALQNAIRDFTFYLERCCQDNGIIMNVSEAIEGERCV